MLFCITHPNVWYCWKVMLIYIRIAWIMFMFMVNNTKIKIIIIMKEKQIRVCAADYKCTCNEIFIECINIYIISWMLCIVISIKSSYELPNIFHFDWYRIMIIWHRETNISIIQQNIIINAVKIWKIIILKSFLIHKTYELKSCILMDR